MSTWIEPLKAAILAIPADVDKKAITKEVNLAIKERNARQGAAKEALTQGQHKRFIDLWCTAYEAKFGAKYAFFGGKDGEAVKKLLAFGFDVEHLMRIAKAAWDNPNAFFCKAAGSLTGFMSKINEIRMELNAMRIGGKKGLPQFQQLAILRDMKANHVCNQNSTAFDETLMTAEKRKEYADIKRKIMELEQIQRQQALG